MVSEIIHSLVFSLYTLLPYNRIKRRCSGGRIVTSDSIISHILLRYEALKSVKRGQRKK